MPLEGRGIGNWHQGDVFAAFRDHPDLRVALLRTAGDKFFCPGWDLKAAADGDAVDGDYGQGGFGGLQELRDMNKPVIVAVQGICCGGGLELAISGDIILASDRATFALPEIRSGTVADAASIGGMMIPGMLAQNVSRPSGSATGTMKTTISSNPSRTSSRSLSAAISSSQTASTESGSATWTSAACVAALAGNGSHGRAGQP